jgi:hypothetical protein
LQGGHCPPIFSSLPGSSFFFTRSQAPAWERNFPAQLQLRRKIAASHAKGCGRLSIDPGFSVAFFLISGKFIYLNKI